MSHILSNDGKLAWRYPSLTERLKNESIRPRSAAVVKKVEHTLTAIRSAMHESRLEAFLLLQQHRTLTPSVAAVVDRFAVTSARRLNVLL